MKKITLILLAITLSSGLDFDDIPRNLLDKYKDQNKFADDLKEITDDNNPGIPKGLDKDNATDFAVDENLYKVGPGDEFKILYDEESLEIEVNIEGKLTLKEIGEIQVNGLFLKEAREKIKKAVNAVYTKAPCIVNLLSPKSMIIFITGAVSVPGSYQVDANHRLSHVLVQAKWFRPDAQKGIAIITHADSTVDRIDLGKFLMEGDLSQNPYLTQGAVVHIPFLDNSKPYVTVRRNNWEIVVQLQGKENLREVFHRYNLYRSTLLPNYFIVIRDGSKEKVNNLVATSYYVKSGDYIDISDFKEFVYVGGTIGNPGPLVYNADYTVIDYLSQKGITRSSSISRKTKVLRSDGKKEYLDFYSTNIQPGDVLIVKDNFQQQVTIWSPIFVSIVSMSLAILTLTKL